MTVFSTTHLLFLLVTFSFYAISTFVVTKVNKTVQNIFFLFAVIVCCGGIFYRYAMGLSFSKAINLPVLFMEFLQVCNFNFVLVILMLVPKFEIARQYSAYFSLFAALTTLISVPSSWETLNWNSPTILNFWIYHAFAIAWPVWMIASRRLKPEKKYALKVCLCVICYFTISAIIQTILIKYEIITINNSFSYIFNTKGNPLFNFLYNLIPVPFFYLLGLVPFMFLFFILLARIFKNYKTEPFTLFKKR